MKIAILCCASSRLFLAPVEKALASGGHVTRRFERAFEALNWADGGGGVFVEWAKQEAVTATTAFDFDGPIVIRCHRYEVHEPEFKKINFKKKNVRLVVTSMHLAARVADAIGPDAARMHFIPSFIDFGAFPLCAPPLSEGLKIAVVGYVEGRKQPGLALAAFDEIKKGYDATLDFVGTARDPYWEWYVKDRGANLIPWTDDPASIWKTHNVVLSASADEGCPYNVVEAMACGAMPLVRRYEGADEQFPRTLTWATIDELQHALANTVGTDSVEPRMFRDWAFGFYSIEANRAALLALFDDVGAAR